MKKKIVIHMIGGPTLPTIERMTFALNRLGVDFNIVRHPPSLEPAKRTAAYLAAIAARADFTIVSDANVMEIAGVQRSRLGKVIVIDGVGVEGSNIFFVSQRSPNVAADIAERIYDVLRPIPTPKKVVSVAIVGGSAEERRAIADILAQSSNPCFHPIRTYSGDGPVRQVYFEQSLLSNPDILLVFTNRHSEIEHILGEGFHGIIGVIGTVGPWGFDKYFQINALPDHDLPARVLAAIEDALYVPEN